MIRSALLSLTAKRCCCEARLTSVDEAFQPEQPAGPSLSRRGAGGERRIAVSGQNLRESFAIRGKDLCLRCLCALVQGTYLPYHGSKPL